MTQTSGCAARKRSRSGPSGSSAASAEKSSQGVFALRAARFTSARATGPRETASACSARVRSSSTSARARAGGATAGVGREGEPRCGGAGGVTGTGRDGDPRGMGDGGCSAAGVGRDADRGMGDGGCSAAGVGRDGEPRAGAGGVAGRICVPPERIWVAAFPPPGLEGVRERPEEMVRRKSSRET